MVQDHDCPLRKVLLLVEDDSRVREALRCCLEHLGYGVDEETTDSGAVVVAKRQHDVHNPTRHPHCAGWRRGPGADRASEKLVLLVEDDAGVRQATRSCLEHMGYGVIEAATGVEILVLAERDQPDLILFDVGWRDGDGLVLVRELRWRPRTRHIPIAAFTCKPISSRRAEVLAGLCSGKIPGPVTPAQLGQDVRLLLNQGNRAVRQFPRYPARATIGWRAVGNRSDVDPGYATGVARTLSQGGLMLELPLPLPVASRVELLLHAPMGGVSAVGKVVWSMFRKTPGEGVYHHGLQFLGLDAAGRAAIQELITVVVVG